MDLIHKTGNRLADTYDFILTTETPDRVGDVVMVDGINLKSFEANPIALYMHDHSEPIGVWSNIRKQGNALLGTLNLAAKGTSNRVDFVRALIAQGILKAVSISFRGLDVSPITKGKPGYLIKASELIEISLVTVPMNPLALMVAKSLHLSESEINQFLAVKPVNSDQRKALPINPLLGVAKMNLSDKIKAFQKTITDKKAKMMELTGLLDGSDTDDAVNDQLTGVMAEIAIEEKSLNQLLAVEKAMANNAYAGISAPAIIAHRGDHADPASLLVKTAVATFEAHIKKVPIAQCLEDRYASARDIEEIRAVAGLTTNKAAQSPAQTNVATWAQELVQVSYGAFMDLLTPESVVANLPMTRFSFDGYGSIIIPNRASRTKNLGAAFRAEGAPIRVGAAVLGSKTLTPKSMGIIGSFTNELFKRSTPNIEMMIRQWMIEDTSMALDTSFLGAQAGTATTPAGIANALGANSVASTGATAAEITADARGMLGRMANALLGRRPVWIMSPSNKIALQLALTPAGTLAFPSVELNNTFAGYPILTSMNVPLDEVFLVDAAEIDFAGGIPEFLGTDVATIHEEDTTPLALASGAQGSAVVATPARSLFQTNSAAIRAVWELDWLVMRTGAVQLLTGVAW